MKVDTIVVNNQRKMGRRRIWDSVRRNFENYGSNVGLGRGRKQYSVGRVRDLHRGLCSRNEVENS